MPIGASDTSKWQRSQGAVDDLVVVLDEMRGTDGASCELIHEEARQLSSQATALAKRQDRAEFAAIVVALVLSFVISGLWVAIYPTTAIPLALQGQGDTTDVLRRVLQYTDLAAVIAFALVLLGSFALISWGLVYAVQRWLFPGELALQLVRALDFVVASPTGLKGTAIHYARVEAAFLAVAPGARTQFARTQRRSEAAAAARGVGQLELELRGVSRVPTNHRAALARLVCIVLLDKWEALGELVEPETLSGRIASAGHAAPQITRIAGLLAALTSVFPLVQATWSMLQALVT